MNNPSPESASYLTLGRASSGLRWVLALLLVAFSVGGHAQTAPCTAPLRDTTKPLFYPPIAFQAHVYGEVILLATFSPDGATTSVRVLSGNELFREAATSFVQGFRARSYTGPRECPFVINFLWDSAGDSCEGRRHSDTQHWFVCASSPISTTQDNESPREPRR